MSERKATFGQILLGIAIVVSLTSSLSSLLLAFQWFLAGSVVLAFGAVVSALLVPGVLGVIYYFLYIRGKSGKGTKNGTESSGDQGSEAFYERLEKVQLVARELAYKDVANTQYRKKRVELKQQGYDPAQFDDLATLWSEKEAVDFYAPIMNQYVSMTELDEEGNSTLFLQVPDGKKPSDVRDMAPYIASSLDLLRAEPLASGSTQKQVEMLLLQTSPLNRHLPEMEAPVLHMTKEQMEDPYCIVPVAIDSRGNQWGTSLFQLGSGGQRILTSGASGSGKSSIFTQHIMQAVMCDNAEVWLIDGKGSELGMFEDYATRSATTPEEALQLSRDWVEDGTRRSSKLRAQKAKGKKRYSQVLNPIDDDEPVALFGWDEVLGLQGLMDKKDWLELIDNLTITTTLGRSRSQTHLVAGQSFPTTAFPQIIRGNFDGKIAARAANASDAAMVGFTESDIVAPQYIGGSADPRTGMFSTVGQFATKGLGDPTYIKGYFLDPSTIQEHLFRLALGEVMRITE